MVLKIGAGNVTRTHDLLITNQLLYRLSYTSVCRVIVTQSIPEVNKNINITVRNILLLQQMSNLLLFYLILEFVIRRDVK